MELPVGRNHLYASSGSQRVAWGSWDGYEHATKLNGTQVWQQNLGQTNDTNCFPPTVGVASTATVASMTFGGTKTPVVLVGGGAADFYALNANTGAVIWRTPLGTYPDYFTWASPNVYKGSVYVGLVSFGNCPLVHGQPMQMNASTGAIQHVFDVAPKGCKSGGVWGSSTIDETDGSIYFGTGNGKCNKVAPLYSISLVKLRASDLTYLSSWQIPLAQRTTADNSFGSTPTLFQATINGVVHQLVGIDDENGMYYAFDRTNISNGPVWQDAVANTGSCPECGDGSVSPSA